MTNAELIARYRGALEEIAYHGTSQSPAMNIPADHWYRKICFSMIGIAARAIRGDSDDA